MTKFFTGAVVVAATLAGALPGAAQGLRAPANLSHDALVAWAKNNGICKTAVSDAVYNTKGEAVVTCTPATSTKLGGATPVAAVIVGVGLAAAAMGSGGGSNSTSGTNGTNGTN